MRGTMVDVETRDGIADAYLVWPDGDGTYPGVLLYQDAFGLRPRLKEMADRIADHGFVVLAPNLLYRAGRSPQFDLSGLDDPERRAEVIGRIMPFVAGLNNGNLVSDAQSYLDALAGLDGVVPGPVVIVGYCMGGMNALLTIEAYPERVKAIASFHGARLATDQPDSPHLKVGAITGRLYLAFAENDHSMPAEQIDKLTAALDEAGVRYTSEVYQGAQHGFAMADTAAYSEEAEKRHWVNLFELLDRTR